jgi:hypothetical protein
MRNKIIYRAAMTVLLLGLAISVAALAESVDLAVVVEAPDGTISVFRFPEGSTSMRINFGGEAAEFGIYTATCVFLDEASIAAEGGFEGFQITDPNSFDRTIEFTGPGMVSSTTMGGDVVATFHFSGTGAVSQGFEATSEVECDPEQAYVLIQVAFGDLWIEVVNGRLVMDPPPNPPKLRVLSMSARPVVTSRSAPTDSTSSSSGSNGSQDTDPGNEPPGDNGNNGEQQVKNLLDGGVDQGPAMASAGGGGSANDGGPSGGREIALLVENTGGSPLSGPIRVYVGPSYARGWVPEGIYWFVREEITSSTLFPQQQGVITIRVPPIPHEIYNAFQERRRFYPDYVDPDPEQDYLGIIIDYGPRGRAYSFLPLDPAAETMTIVKKSHGNPGGTGD